MRTLSQCHPLFPKRSDCVGRHLIGNDIHIVDSLLAASTSAKGRVDIFGEHVSMHLEVTNDIRPPPSVATAEESKLKHAAATRVGNSIYLVKLDGDHARQKGLIGVVDNATALDNARLLFQKSLGRPAHVVRMWTVVRGEDADIVGRTRVCGEEMIGIVGFGGRIRDFDDCELLILSRQCLKMRFDWLNGPRSVIDES